VEMLRRDDWKGQLSQYTDAVTRYPEWFGNLRDVLLNYCSEDSESGQEGETPPPD